MSGVRNKLCNLSDHLFEQLERLNDGELKSEDLKSEIERTSSMCDISMQLVAIGKLQLEAKKLTSDLRGTDEKMPRLLEE